MLFSGFLYIVRGQEYKHATGIQYKEEMSTFHK